MAALLQCEDLCGDTRVLSVGATLGSLEHFTPVQTSSFCHSMPDPDLPASTAVTIPSSSLYFPARMQRWSGANSCDAEYFEGEASKDFWGEFGSSEIDMNQLGVDEINQEVDDDQMGRPVLVTRKRHKGLLGGVTEVYPTV